ncbi:DUF1667 domain-containing protein [Pseudothermotoga thermarum]|uniref:Molybdopterin oxidoreductase n=1 Tax=Pseudothermotoga thermarum DSM 5069 TaxID=688269 RepID=F7YYP1_9THEM|nr:DUF1667 domain-containing protein [Pseudothermotoga thermarum]AEH51074.1 protein of unknown function DUF1667 [Pseudothermotoga thermarum DSM 5069]
MNRIVCVQCPVGCKIKFELVDGKLTKIEGNKCPRGLDYLKDELADPKRIIPTSVRVIDGEYELVSVKTSKPISKKYIPQLMEILKKIKINAPVKVGDVVLKNFMNTNVDIIATRSVSKRDVPK